MNWLKLAVVKRNPYEFSISKHELIMKVFESNVCVHIFHLKTLISGLNLYITHHFIVEMNAILKISTPTSLFFPCEEQIFVHEIVQKRCRTVHVTCLVWYSKSRILKPCYMGVGGLLGIIWPLVLKRPFMTVI